MCDDHDSELEDSDDSLLPLLQEVARTDMPFGVPRPGERLGGEDNRRFEVLEELGKGGMGRVFRALDTELQRIVALKFPQFTEGLAETVSREAKAIAQLNHKHIVHIFDVEKWTSEPWASCVPFLVMEYLEGESLAALLRREGRLELRRALDILGEVTEGLAHAHAQDIIHRDLKPSNVMLDRRGQVKLLDFGLAWVSTPTSACPAGVLSPGAGTPAYMAPEQWQPAAPDARMDIWAAGVLLYEMLTGELPYSGDNIQALREQVLSAQHPPKARMRRPELPLAVDDALLRLMLAKEPDRRIPTARELHERLKDIERRLGPRREAPRPIALQHRQVTLVACSLSGLSGLAEHLDAEDLGVLEAVFHQSCARIIQEHGGSITLDAGNELLACFGYPVTREDDSEYAVRAALQLLREVPEALQSRLPALPCRQLSLQVALHTDLVALPERAPVPPGRTPPLYGDAPKLATWLAHQAAPGTVVLSDTAWTLVRSICRTEPLGARDFQGTLGTTRIFAHRLLEERHDPYRFYRAHTCGRLTPLVGREHELHTLLTSWEQATRGHGSLVLLQGEAGIGKSRLIQELAAQVSPVESFHMRGQCWSQFSNTALHPLSEQLQRTLRASMEACGGRLSQALAAFLERHDLPREHQQPLESLLAPPLPQEPSVGAPTSERHKEQLFEALADVLLRMSEERPVLAILEDLHWADDSTLQLLGFLVERLASARVLLLLSARPDFQPTWPQRAWTHPLPLEHLSTEHTAALVKKLSQGRVFPAETIQHLVRHTDGIPLFVEEMMRMVLECAPDGSIETLRDSGSIPVTLRELLLARLDQLPERQKELAQRCAVMGRDFTHAQLTAIWGFDDETLKWDVLGLLEAGLLQRQREAAEPGYQFRHALMQEAAWRSLPRGKRREYHQRIAQVLEREFPETAEERPELLAHHYTEAEEPEKALRYWTLAGERASQRSANVEAVSHLTQALELLRGLPDASRRGHEELHLLTALSVPLAQLQRYRTQELEQLHQRALELFCEVEEEWQLELSHWGLFHYYFARGEFTQAHRLAERLVDMGKRNPELLILGHRMKATLCFTWGRLAEALEHVEHVLERSHFTLEEHRALALKHWVDPRTMALAYSALIYSVLHEPERARSCGREALALAGKIGHPHTQAYALTHVALASLLRKEYEEARRRASDCIALSREHRLRLWLGWSTVIQSAALAGLGQCQEGLLLMQRSLEQWRDSGIRLSMPSSLGLLASLLLKQGRPHEALEKLREALELVRTTGERSFEAELHRLQGEAFRVLGQREEARHSFFRALVVAREQRAGTYQLRTTVSLSRLLLDMGRPCVARRLLERLRDHLGAGHDSVDLLEAHLLLAQLSENPWPDLLPSST